MNTQLVLKLMMKQVKRNAIFITVDTVGRDHPAFLTIQKKCVRAKKRVDLAGLSSATKDIYTDANLSTLILVVLEGSCVLSPRQ